MSEDQLEKICEQLQWLTAAVLNNTVKQVEVECVRAMGRELTAQEKDMIHYDCLDELADVRELLLAHLKKSGGK